jgi:hypothetical protein
MPMKVIPATIENYGTESTPIWTVVESDPRGRGYGRSLGQYGADRARAEQHVRQLSEGIPQPSQSGNFRAPHFGSEGQNVLAHTRFDDRVTTDGKRTLFVEEVQSDWHQKGKKEGYKGPELDKQIAETTAHGDKANADYRTGLNDLATVLKETGFYDITDPASKKWVPFEHSKGNWLITHSNAPGQRFSGPTFRTEGEAQEWLRNRFGRGAASGLTPEGHWSLRVAKDYHAKLMQEYTDAPLQTPAKDPKYRSAVEEAFAKQSRLGHAIEKVETAQREEEEARAELSKLNRNAVPDAPFKSDWQELVIKRLLRHAAENGYDSMSWVTGEQTAERYDLSKQISEIGYDTDGQVLRAFDHHGHEVITKRGIAPDSLADYVGKEPAKKLLETPPVAGIHTLKGVDLKVGGEWAKNLYDRAIVNFLNKYAKKWGAKVETTELPTREEGTGGGIRVVTEQEYWERTGKDVGMYAPLPQNADKPITIRIFPDGMWARTGPDRFESKDAAQKWADRVNREEEKLEKVHTIQITPEMKKSVLKEGQPIAKSGGAGAIVKQLEEVSA